MCNTGGEHSGILHPHVIIQGEMDSYLTVKFVETVYTDYKEKHHKSILILK